MSDLIEQIAAAADHIEVGPKPAAKARATVMPKAAKVDVDLSEAPLLLVPETGRSAPLKLA